VAVVRLPVGERIVAVVVVQPRAQLVQQVGLEQEAALFGTERQVRLAGQLARDAAVEQVELRMRDLLDRLLELPGRQPVGEQGVD